MSYNDWQKYVFSDLVEIIGGGTPKTSNLEFWDGDINWLSVVDFNNDFRHVFNTEKTITEKGLQNSSTKILSKDDVIISARGTVGAIAQLAKPMAFNQSCYGLKAKQDYITKDFLYYLLKFNILSLKSNTHGSVFDTITKETFNSLKVSIPSLETQKAIANILSSLDDKIELNNKINKNLEEIAQTLYKRWFVDFEFPNEYGEPYKSSGGEMVDSELGMMPKGWEVATLEDLAAKEKNAIVDGPFGTQMKISEYVDFGIPIVEMYQLNGYENVKGYRNFITLKKYEEVKRSTVKQGDVIISKTGTLGLLGMLNRKYDKGILVSRLGKITPDTSIIKSSTLLLLMHYLSDSNHWYQIASGSTMPLLNIGNIKKTKIVFPIRNSEISLKFESIVDEMIQKINSNLFENHKLSIMRDELLPKLMSGEIEVPVEE